MRKEYRSFNGKDYLALSVVLRNLGRIEIVEEFLALKQHIIGVPSYDPRAVTNEMFGYGEDDFCNDLEAFVDIINTNDRGEDTFFIALDIFIDKHVDTYHRLIDTDLLRSVSILVELMGAVAAYSDEELDLNDKVGIFKSLVRREISRCQDVFYVVKYRLEGNIQKPYLVKY